MPAAEIRLKADQLRKYQRVAKIPTDKALAAAMGIDHGTLSRALRGTAAPGARVIAGALSAFPDVDFADLFDVVAIGTDEDAA